MSPHQTNLHAARMRRRNQHHPAHSRGPTPEDRGFRDGLQDQHYLPALRLSPGDDWIHWLAGWRAGQAELRRRDITQQGFSSRGLQDRQLPLFPGEHRQLPHEVAA